MKLPISICVICFALAGCGDNIKPSPTNTGSFYWMDACDIVAKVIEHRRWKTAAWPKNYSEIRAEVEKIRLVSRPAAYHHFTWRITPVADGKSARGLRATLEVEFWDKKTNYRNSLRFDTTTLPPEKVWRPHRYLTADGDYVLAESEENLADEFAQEIYGFNLRTGKWPSEQEMRSYSRLTSDTKNKKGFEFHFEGPASKPVKIVLRAMASGTIYKYPSEGPDSGKAPEIVRTKS